MQFPVMQTVWTQPCKWSLLLLPPPHTAYKPNMIESFQWLAFIANSLIKGDEPKCKVNAVLGTECCLWCFVINNVTQIWEERRKKAHIDCMLLHSQFMFSWAEVKVFTRSPQQRTLGCTTSHVSSIPALDFIRISTNGMHKHRAARRVKAKQQQIQAWFKKRWKINVGTLCKLYM